MSIWRGVGWMVLVTVIACGGDDASTSTGTNSGGANSGGSSAGGANEGGSTTTSGGGTINPGDCVTNNECPGDEICVNGECLAGCASDKPCAGGLACCSGVCIDTLNDIANCGTCDMPCQQPANIAVSCDLGMCSFGMCDPGFFDCDGQPSTGCETMNACSCTPGSTQPCYPGPAGTAGVGICQTGTQNCNAAGTAWSLCGGFVAPAAEQCANNIDEDCNGVVDDVLDLDNDGWTVCDNDCCETTMDCMPDPNLVNPGAFEVIGNMIDDDCDASTSDTVPPPACSTAAKFGGITPMDMVQAIDLCQTTTANPPLSQKKWGVVSAQFRLANGNSPSAAQLNNMQTWQSAIMVNYGTVVTPQVGNTMAGISSGRMRDQNDPNYVNPNNGVSFGSASTPPAAYLAAHGGQLPASAGCSGNCPSGSGANDSINLRMSIRVPTNALSMAYQFRYFTSEYWCWSCTVYNDFYLALLTSGAPGLPADKNISFDALNNPVSVNNGFFDICQGKGCYMCPLGPPSTQLPGTGMQLGDNGAIGCVSAAPGGQTGGGTVWLKTTAPVLPGETIQLELMVFDVADNILDSLSLLDAFEWTVSASGVGTGPAG